ncbi:MAG: hypothetical protein H8D78_07700 [Chloroflexi bacterium]|nr:hypothetical protein [Chloroflexota bacterium]
MDTLNTFGQMALDIIVYLTNGVLLLAYSLLGQLPLLLSLVCAAVIVFRFDPEAQSQTQFQAGRDLRPAAEKPQVLRHHQALTGMATLLWVIAAAFYPSPVPWLGLAMWALTLVGLFLLPGERVSLLWRSKTFIITYALALLAFRAYLALIGSATPQAWAAVVGSSAEAQRVLASNRGLLNTIGFWVSCFALPAAQVVYLMQRLTTHPMSLLGPRMRPADMVGEIRTRGDD